MKQFNSVIASALVSGLIVAGMVGIGVNALTTPGAPANNVAAQVTLNPNASTSQQSRQSSSRGTTRRTSDTTLESAE